MEPASVVDLHGRGYEHVHEDARYAAEILQSCCMKPHTKLVQRTDHVAANSKINI